MKVIQVIPAFRLAGADVMCENLCVALKNAGIWCYNKNVGVHPGILAVGALFFCSRGKRKAAAF